MIRAALARLRLTVTGTAVRPAVTVTVTVDDRPPGPVRRAVGGPVGPGRLQVPGDSAAGVPRAVTGARAGGTTGIRVHGTESPGRRITGMGRLGSPGRPGPPGRLGEPPERPAPGSRAVAAVP